jgi:hypothetical protein
LFTTTSLYHCLRLGSASLALWLGSLEVRLSSRLVKTKRKIIFGALAVLAVGYVISIVPNFRNHSERIRTVEALQGLPRDRVDSAIQSFVGAQKAKGRSVSETVSLRELVAGGFLRAEEAAPFGGADVTFAVSVDETRPQQIVARVPLSNGQMVVELADGSIQQIHGTR